jgi:hypothetical protein
VDICDYATKYDIVLIVVFMRWPQQTMGIYMPFYPHSLPSVVFSPKNDTTTPLGMIGLF